MCAKKTGSIEDLAVIGIDTGKDTFHLDGFDRSGQPVNHGITPGLRLIPKNIAKIIARTAPAKSA